MKILNARGETSFWQWDTGRKVVIIGDEDICGEAHFCTGGGDPFPVAVRTEDGQRVVDVPDEVLQTAKPFTVYLYHKTDRGGATRYSQRFTIYPRTKPADYIYTPSEKLTWEQLNERIRKLEESGGVDVTGAEPGQILVVEATDDTGKPTKWGTVDMPEQINADWDQNDPNAPDYIKNRPFYDDPGAVTKALDGVNPVVDADFFTAVSENIEKVRCFYGSKTYEFASQTQSGAGYIRYYFASTVSSNDKIYIWFTTGDSKYDTVCVKNSYGTLLAATITVTLRDATFRQLDEKFIPDTIARKTDIPAIPDTQTSPLLLDADQASAYEIDFTHGDEALKAIKDGRQILVRVPNADGGNHTAIYCPIMMYQLPNYQNRYLYLFFLRDEKQDLSALLGQPAGTVLMPTYGQLKMMLDQEYNSNPLEA